MAGRSSEFLKPTVHIGWLVGLIIAIAGQLITMYAKVSTLEESRTMSARELDQIQDQLKELRNKTCLTK